MFDMKRKETHTIDNKIEIRDRSGKLFAKMTSNRKRLKIVQKGRFVELIVNEHGQFEQINK